MCLKKWKIEEGVKCWLGTEDSPYFEDIDNS